MLIFNSLLATRCQAIILKKDKEEKKKMMIMQSGAYRHEYNTRIKYAHTYACTSVYVCVCDKCVQKHTITCRHMYACVNTPYQAYKSNLYHGWSCKSIRSIPSPMKERNKQKVARS